MAIDSRLRWILEERSAPHGALQEALALVESPSTRRSSSSDHGPRKIDILVRGTPGADQSTFKTELEKLNLEVHTIVGTRGNLTATGRIEIDDLALLDASSFVARVEAPRELQPELTVSLPHCTATAAHALEPSASGKATLVGVIDGGIDIHHAVFRDEHGKSRIVALWDQMSPAQVGGSVPYGRVYTQVEIDAAISGAQLDHADPGGHGTHVTSIAAGAGQRPGIAKAASIIVVALGGDDQTLGRSKNAIDAFDWIVTEAEQRNLPVAVNMSLGMNGGSHAGTSILEAAMDAHCRKPSVALVKSAGNEQEWRIHASGTLVANAELTLEVLCQSGKFQPGQLEIWFDENDDIEVSVQPPSGNATAWTSLNEMPKNAVLAGGNRIRIDAEYDPEGTGDNLINVFFAAGGSAIGILPGTWRVLLRARTIGADGRVHAWLERTARRPAAEQLRFSASSYDPSCTISIPGTARRVITVGSYVTTPNPPGSALVGALSSFSGRGPTRFDVQKPDLVAPGEYIEAARSSRSPGVGEWISLPGTSMAAPHVAGAAAILLSEKPELTGEQVRQILCRSARAAASGPDSAFGSGYLDVAAAVALLRNGAVTFPEVLSTRIEGATFQIKTGADTTASLLYDAHRGRLLAGKRAGSMPSLAPSRTHTFVLSALGRETSYFEVHLFSNGWRSIADNHGGAFCIVVP